MEKLYLQNRWKLNDKSLSYYGIRKFPYTTINTIKLSKSLVASFLKDADGNITYSGKIGREATRLIDENILVPKEKLLTTPSSLENARICKNCIANDFIIPGIEFDGNGLCPMCAQAELNKNLIAPLPIRQEFPSSTKSRFDVAIFYTGGKDSTYLLYYFSKVLNLRVLAMTWEIPFMSENARKSIENAKKHLRNVEFVNRYVAPEQMNVMYKDLIKRQDNTCACPTIAYLLFFPTLVAEKVPYLILGNEPAQTAALYYNSMAPKIVYNFSKKPFLLGLMNFLRVLSFKKPVKSGQYEFGTMLKQLIYGSTLIAKFGKYKNPLTENVISSLDAIENLKNSLKPMFRYADRGARLPSLVHFDLNQAFDDGVYDWTKTIQIIKRETGWIPPDVGNKALHTSCCVEIAKDYSQFIHFYKMDTPVIPFSALEISIASAVGTISREKALEELKNHLGFTLTRPDEHLLMHQCNGCSILMKDLKK